MAVLTAFLLMALGAIAGIVISTCFAIRFLPDSILSAALPHELFDEYVMSLKGTWRGYAARKIVAISRSRLLALIFKGSWVPISIVSVTLGITLGVLFGAVYFETLPLWIATFCVFAPLLQVGMIAFIALRVIVGYMNRLRAAGIDWVSKRLVKMSGDRESS